MDEQTAVLTVHMITRIPTRKLRLGVCVAGSMNALLRNAKEIDAPLTDLQRETLSGLYEVARYMFVAGGTPV